MKIDHSNEGPSRALSTEIQHFRRIRGDERGQATVEFALILIPLLLLVVGIIQFGIGLNFWLDMNRIANQGARWAAVNCARSATTPPSYNPCSPSLQQTLRAQATSQGLRNSNLCIDITYVSKVTGGSSPYPGNNVGDPIRVRLKMDYGLVPLLRIGALRLGASATMRMEQEPTNVPETASCP